MTRRIYIPTDDVDLRTSIKAHNTAARKAKATKIASYPPALVKKHGILSDGTLDVGCAGLAKLLSDLSRPT